MNNVQINYAVKYACVIPTQMIGDSHQRMVFFSPKRKFTIILKHYNFKA